MGEAELVVLITAALLVAVVAIAVRSFFKTRKQLQQAALSAEGEWLEQEVRLSSVPPASPLGTQIMAAELELARLREHARRSIHPAFGPPDPRVIPPPPPEIMRLSQVPLFPSIPPPPPSKKR